MMDKRFRLPEEAYYPSPEYASRYATQREREKEYIRLRGIVQKRLDRLIAEKLPTQGMKKTTLPTLTELKGGDLVADPKQLAKRLAEARRFIEAPTLLPEARKVKADRYERARETLNERGYDIETEEEYNHFVDFMQAAEAIYGKKYRPSDEVAILADLVEKGAISKDEVISNFEEFVENARDLESIYGEWAGRIHSGEGSDYWQEKLNEIMES